jgi:lipoprotein-releasing system ATP-binding protein
MPDAALEVRGLSKEYSPAGGPLRVLADVDLSLAGGDAIAVMGPSGSGKSTLLYILGALEPPTSGTVTLDGVNPFGLPEKQQAAFRNEKVGFVFQDHCLLPQCTVLENVLIPTLVAPRADYRTRALELLERVGLSHRLDHLPAELSGGEKQRVAVARALVRDPLLLLCDEPTGNLDRAAADTVVSLVLELARARGAILVVVTHSAEVAARFPIVSRLAGGRLERCEVPHTRPS